MNRRRLTPLPDGVMLIIPTRIMPFVTSPLISVPGKLRMGMDLVIPRRRDCADESVAAFVRRRLGNEALEKIAEPLMSGIHVSDPEMQSLLGTFPRFRAMEEKYRSLILGMLAGKRARRTVALVAPQANGDGTGGRPGAMPVARRGDYSMGANGRHGLAGQPGSATAHSPSAASTLFVTLRDGLGSLVDALGKELQGEVFLGTQATALERQGNRYVVRTEHGQTFAADAVVLATPAYVSAQLATSIAPQLAGLLGCIRYVSTATISLGYRAADAEECLHGFGYVVPRQEHRQIAACTWTSTKFDHRAPSGMALVRCFAGGPGHEEQVDLPDEDLVRLARLEMAQLMGLQAEPVLTRVFRWRRSNPQYDVGHLDRVKEMHALCAAQPGLSITGSAYEGVGVPDCVHQGQFAAGHTLNYLLGRAA